MAAIHLEDQVNPKRCGHIQGKELVPCEEMEGKLRAAADARRDGELVIIARTDARGPAGLDAAIERANRYREAGADMTFPDALLSEEEFEAFAPRGAGTEDDEHGRLRGPAHTPRRCRSSSSNGSASASPSSRSQCSARGRGPSATSWKG